MAVLKAFIDDSGSGSDSPWYVLAGYLGTVEGWDSFDGQWEQVLHEPPRIEYFKSSAELKKLQVEGWARPVETDQETLWMFYDVEM